MGTEIFQFNIVSIVVSDALATQEVPISIHDIDRLEFLYYTRNDFNYPGHVIVEEWHKF